MLFVTTYGRLRNLSFSLLPKLILFTSVRRPIL